MMIKHIFEKELLEYFKSLRFTLGWLVLFVMVIGSVLLLNAEVAERLEQHEKTARAQAETISNFAHMNRINAMIWPGRPVEKMELFFRGLDNESENTSFFSDPFARLFPKVDLLYIATILLSLLAFIFTYDSLCGEKENGTLKLIHVNHVSRGRWWPQSFLPPWWQL
jgi:ABC-type transport system involved in multi-copper enzyme maturation permease subunit